MLDADSIEKRKTQDMRLELDEVTSVHASPRQPVLEYLQEAIDFSRETHRINAFMAPMLCSVWDRIGNEIEIPQVVGASLDQLRQDWGCRSR